MKQSPILNSGPYQAAIVQERTLFDSIQLIITLLINLTICLALMVPSLAKDAYRMISPKPKKNIAGKLALVSGGANGIGREIALELGKHGCNVAIVDIDQEASEKTVADLKSLSVKSKAYTIDITDKEAVRALKTKIETDIGPVDILVNNAGLMMKCSIDDCTDEEIEQTIQVNLNSHFHTIRTFLPTMIERKSGHIVAMSSLAGLVGMAHATVYSATKFAVSGLMQGLAQECKIDPMKKHIKFTTAYPYFVATRKELIDCLKLQLPAVTPHVAGKAIVDAILRNKQIILIPKIFHILTLLSNLLTLDSFGIFRNRLYREKSVIYGSD